MVFIYTLSEPGTDVVRYVGMSRQPSRRIKEHRRASSTNLHLNHWIRSLPDGPSFTVIAKVEEEHRNNAERFWISLYRMAGADLLNLAEGGEGLRPWEDWKRKRQSALMCTKEGSKRGLQRGPEYFSRISKLRKSNKGGRPRKCLTLGTK